MSKENEKKEKTERKKGIRRSIKIEFYYFRVGKPFFSSREEKQGGGKA